MKHTKMVAFDTSSTITGYSVYEDGVLQEHGIINLSKEKNINIRMEDMCLGIIKILNDNIADIVIVEEAPYVHDPNAHRLLSEIVGVARGWALCNFADFDEIRPNEWRKWICNKAEKVPTNRKDCKLWDIEKVKKIFKFDPVDDNEADAVLIGYARIKQMSFYANKKIKE